MHSLSNWLNSKFLVFFFPFEILYFCDFHDSTFSWFTSSLTFFSLYSLPKYLFRSFWFSFYFTTGFNFGTTDILGWMIVVWGCPVHCRVFISMSDLCLLHGVTPPPTAHVTATKNVPWESKIVPGWQPLLYKLSLAILRFSHSSNNYLYSKDSWPFPLI